MRELRFRVWNKNAKDFVRESENRIAHFDLILFSYYARSGGLENLDNYIVQQFTGLKDKNGIDIYEGDILNWESNSMSHRLGECKRIRVVEVKWDQERAAFITCQVGHKGIIPTWKMDANDFNGKPFIKEVIGNVFENKDLLN